MLTASPLTVCVRSGRLSQLSLMQSSSSRSLQFSMPRCHLNIRHLIYIIGTESSSLFVLALFKRTGIGTGIIMFILTIPSPTNGVLLHMNTQFSAITETVLFFFFFLCFSYWFEVGGTQLQKCDVMHVSQSGFSNVVWSLSIKSDQITHTQSRVYEVINSLSVMMI